MAKFFEELQYLKPLKRLCNFLAFHSGTGWARIRACQASISSSVKGIMTVMISRGVMSIV